MTLDEAIFHCEEVAELNKSIAYNTDTENWMDIAQCEKCAEEHRQLAEWLKELKKRHWIPVTERLPENEVNVLITVERRPIGRKPYRRVVRAFYEDGTWSDIRSAYSWDDDSWDDYVDEDGNFLIPEGWFEAIDYHGEFCAVDDFVIAWMPLPEPFKGATT